MKTQYKDKVTTMTLRSTPYKVDESPLHVEVNDGGRVSREAFVWDSRFFFRSRASRIAGRQTQGTTNGKDNTEQERTRHGKTNHKTRRKISSIDDAER